MAGPSQANHSWLTRISLFLAGFGGLSIIWSVALPAIAEWPAVSRQQEFLDANRIDPSAMFYSELDNLDWTAGRFLHEEHPELWQLSDH